MHHFLHISTKTECLLKIRSWLRLVLAWEDVSWGHTLRTNGPRWISPWQSHLVSLSIPLCTCGCVRTLPLFQSSAFEKCGLHTQFEWKSAKSRACEMILKGIPLMDCIHALNHSQGNRESDAYKAFTSLPWHFLSRCWWHFHTNSRDESLTLTFSKFMSQHHQTQSNSPRDSSGDERW